MSKLDRWILGLVASVGALLPWATGAGVKLYLQAHGKPTLPWSAFVAPTDLLLEIPLTLWFASPYLVLAFVARAVFRDKRVPFLTTTSSGERRALVLLSLGLGSVCTIVTFKGIFWAFDPCTSSLRFRSHCQQSASSRGGLWVWWCLWLPPTLGDAGMPSPRNIGALELRAA